jgi:hypothetical protein
MSDTVTITADNGDTYVRQPRNRRERDAPEVHVEAEVITPELAVEDAREQLQAKDRQVAEARRVAREADQRRQAAEAQVIQAQEGRVNDRQTVVAQALEGAKSEQAAAKLAIRSAREMGDVDAELAAQEAFQGSTYRIAQATGELEYLRAQPRPSAQPQRTGRSAEAQQWLDDHPRFNTDRVYRGVATDAHNEALREGHSEGSRSYVDYIDQIMTREFGEGHGQAEDNQQGARPMAQPARRPGSTSLPPSRGGGTGSGWKTVKTELGDLLVQERSDGTRGIRFPNAKTQADFEEGALLDKRASRSPEDFKRALAEYANEHVIIAQEQADGGNGDIVRGDGRAFN